MGISILFLMLLLNLVKSQCGLKPGMHISNAVNCNPCTT